MKSQQKAMMEWKQIISGLVTGAILGIASTFFLFQGRVTTLEEKISKLETENVSLVPSETTTQLKSCPYGIKIESPQSGDSIGGDLKVFGTYKIKPPEGSIQLFLLSPKGQGYFPHGILQFDKINQTWTGDAYIAPGNSDQDIVIVSAVVGESGHVLIDYVQKVGKETGMYPAIQRLTNDIIECDRVAVVTK